jgi:hypothetical protein
MGDRRKKRLPGQEPATADDLRSRVIQQTPAVFVTLVSVLIGLVLSDLVTEARSHMHLWPMDRLAVLTWGQLLSNGISALSVWVVLAHLGVARRRVPHIVETISAFGPPLILLAATSVVGRSEIWPWLYGASVYLAISIVSDTVQVRLTMDQPGGERFAGLSHPLGHLMVCYAGAPLYLAAAILDQHGLLPGQLEIVMAYAPLPTALVLIWMFFRDWRAALEDN